MGIGGQLNILYLVRGNNLNFSFTLSVFRWILIIAMQQENESKTA